MDRDFDLLTSKGKVTWTGTSGEDAAQRWADCHPGETVTAWREHTPEVRVGMIRIVD